jgi:methionine-rich copper-binding protein CopC
MTRSKFIPLALALAVVSPAAAAHAAIKNPQPDAAMRKAIRDYADHGLEGVQANASKINVSCTPVKKVNAKGTCIGSFSLTLDGKTANYQLTKKAGTFRISPGAIEYHLNAKATKKAPGLPAKIGTFAGFLQ